MSTGVYQSVAFAIRADRKSAKRKSGLKGETRRKAGENLNRFPRVPDVTMFGSVMEFRMCRRHNILLTPHKHDSA